jgi:ATP-dependent DNA helicase RecG
MTTADVHRHIAELRQFNADLTHIEAKAASTDLPQHIWRSVSAFSNTQQGGILILGVAERERFQVTGVKNPAKIQHDLASLCSDAMEPAVRATIQLHNLRGKAVVTASIPELPSNQKPCYFKEAGYTNGAYVRVADGNRKLTAYEVQMLLSARVQPVDDHEPVPDALLDDLQARLVKSLLTRVRRRRTPLSRASDNHVLRTLKVLVPFCGWSVCSLG